MLTEIFCIVHLRGRHRHTCLFALPQFSILSLFDCALHRHFPSAATCFHCFPSFARPRPDVLVSPSYVSQGVADIVSPRYRGWPISLYEISGGIESRTSGGGRKNRDPCGRDLAHIFSNYGAFTPEGRNVSTASSHSTPSWI
jgi:hypothetical protein